MNILIALELIENPEDILKKALVYLKGIKSANLYIIHVLENVPKMSFFGDAYLEWLKYRDKAVKKSLQDMMVYLKRLSGEFEDIEPIIEIGDICEKILEQAENVNADVIIIGHHIWTGIKQYIKHDVCEKVMRSSQRSVLSFFIEH